MIDNTNQNDFMKISSGIFPTVPGITSLGMMGNPFGNIDFTRNKLDGFMGLYQIQNQINQQFLQSMSLIGFYQSAVMNSFRSINPAIFTQLTPSFNFNNSTFNNMGASGNSAVDLARKYTGYNSRDVKGLLPNFTAAGGNTNNCADFVSSVLESTGRLKGHYVNVGNLENALVKQGYKQIPASASKPGDVWINNSRGHVEMVSAQGGTKTIGSNNIMQGFQKITERSKSPASGVFYTLA